MEDQTGTEKGSRFLGGTEPQKKVAGSPEPSTLPNQAPAPTPAAVGVRGRSKAGRNLDSSTDLK